MKSKYKVIPNGFGDYDLSKNGNIAAMHMSKHMAYKIKTALEQFEAIQHCVDCKNFKTSGCEPCKITTRINSHFQPREKK